MKEALLRVGLLLFGLTLGLGAVELGLRLLNKPQRGTEFENLADLRMAMLAPSQSEDQSSNSLHSLVQPNPDDKIIFELRSNLDLTFQRARVTTNSCGMRDVERTIAKAPGTYRIALLGDSFAFGWGVEMDQSFAKVLERELNRRAAPGSRFEVLNFGVPGYSTFQEVESFKQKGVEFNPDQILVFFVDNDFGYPFFVRDLNAPGGFLAATQFARLTWKAVDPRIGEQANLMQGLDPNSELKKLNTFARKRGIPVSVVLNPGKNWESVEQRLVFLRKAHGVRRISIVQELDEVVTRRGIKREDLVLTFDPHPSALKHELMGELLVPYFMDRL